MMNNMNPNLTFDDLHTLKKSDIIEYFSFYDTDGNLIQDIKYITVDSHGQLNNIVVDDLGIDKEIPPTDYTYTRESPFVLGVGFLIPGDLVKLKLTDCDVYEIQYGWHTNISNQTIYSWYLKPVDYDEFKDEIIYKTDSNILTLYKEHLETIEVVKFRKNRSSFYAGGEPV